MLAVKLVSCMLVVETVGEEFNVVGLGVLEVEFWSAPVEKETVVD